MPRIKKKVSPARGRSFGIIVCLILSYVFIAPTVYAQKALVLMKNDNTKVYYSLENNPKILFQGGWLRVTKADGHDNFAVTDVDKIDIETLQPSSVEGIEVDNLTVSAGKLIVDSNNGSTAYSIVNIKGVVIQSGILVSGRNVIDLQELATGVYLINVGNETLKISLK